MWRWCGCCRIQIDTVEADAIAPTLRTVPSADQSIVRDQQRTIVERIVEAPVETARAQIGIVGGIAIAVVVCAQCWRRSHHLRWLAVVH